MNTIDFPAYERPAYAYITTAKRSRLTRLAVSSILMTQGGCHGCLAEISRQVGCSVQTVASVKSELQEMGLWGSIQAAAPVPRQAPGVSFASLRDRLMDLLAWFDELGEEGLADVSARQALAETQQILRVIKRKGSLPRNLHIASLRLEELEELRSYPEYDWTLNVGELTGR